MPRREVRAAAPPATPAATGPLPGSPVERLRPRTAPQLLDAGFEVIRFRGRTIGILALVLLGPFFAGSLVMVHLSDNGWLPALLPFRWIGSSRTTGQWALAYGGVAVGWFGEMLFAVGLSTVMRGWLEGTDPTPTVVLRSTLRRLHVIAAAWTVAFALKATGSILFVVGVLLFAPYLSILAPVLAFERIGPLAAVVRCRKLVGRNPERALFLTLVAPVLSIAIPLVLSFGAAQTVQSVDEFATIMGIVATLVLIVARCSATVLLYLDIRVRTEGLDLVLRAPRALGGGA